MTTRYLKIADDLRERITNGTYEAGEKIPALTTLKDEFGVARDTVRHAVGQLIREGLLTATRGFGTVVRDTTPVPLVYVPGKTSQVWSAQTGEENADRVMHAGVEAADPDTAKRLDMPISAKVVYRVRHQTKGAQVAQIHEQWIPTDVVAAIIESTGTDLTESEITPGHDLFSLMALAGNPPTQVTEVVLSRMPHAEEIEILALPAGVPVLITYRITRNDAGRALETSSFTAAADRVSLSYTVPVSR